jgi:hypothetical protein
MARAKSKTPNRATRAKKSPAKSSWTDRLKDQRFMAVIFIVAFAGLGVAATFLTRAATSSATGKITGVASKCLDNLDNKAANGNKISLWTCDGTDAQSWTLPGDGTIRTNGYCLDVKGASKASKTLVQLYKCNGTAAQQWSVKSDGSIINPNSSLCLDDQYAKTGDGNPIWMWPCNQTAAQTWKVPKPTNTPTPPPTTPPTTPTPGNPQTPPTTPPTSNNPSGEKMPGDVAGWKQIFGDDFTGTVPLGGFSDCDHNVDKPSAYCGGLKKYGAYYDNWWAYPNTWGDTAKTGADGNGGAPFGGTYHPEDVVSVDKGAMHVAMFRPSAGGDVHSATLVPRKCMDKTYGRYVERFKVVRMESGFKSAHEFYQNRYEMDFPEGDWGKTISGFAHKGDSQVLNVQTGKTWTEWHTSAIEWSQNSLKYYLDGKLVGSMTTNVANFPMSWLLQNESSIEGPYAKAGAKAQMDIDWVACYSKS